MIQFQDMQALLQAKDRWGNPIPFAIEFVTANRKTCKGGEVIKMEKAVYVWSRGKLAVKKRRMDHFLHGTIDISPLGSRKITTVHVQLIRRFNEKVVA